MLILAVVALLFDAFAVFSRATMQAFSLADAEEWLRVRNRTNALAGLERFAERIKDFSYVFMVMAQFSKAVAILALAQLFIGNENNYWLLTLACFAVGMLVSDAFVRPWP